VWAPGDGVLARVAFPPIRTLDSSQTPRREEQAYTPRTLAAVDLSALREALAGMAGEALGEQTAPAPAGNREASDLERRLRQRDAELAMAQARLARLGAETAGLRARLDGYDTLDGRLTSGDPAVE